MQEITITIDERGNATLDGKGFVGPECETLMQVFEDLGTVTDKTPKAEYHQKRAVARKATA